MTQKAKKPPEDRAVEEEFLRPPRGWLQHPRSKIIIVAVVAVALAVLTSLLWPADPTKNFLPGADHVNQFGAGAIVGATFSVIALLVYFVAKRTLWDLLQLLVVPLALAGIGFWFAAQQDARQQNIEEQRAKAERELAEERAEDEALQAYLDQMSSLLLERNLRESEENSEVRTLARARTLTLLRRVEDPGRKTAVMEFLVEAQLVQGVEGREPIIRLGGTDLNLRDADLSFADLSGADLSGADLSDANLGSAVLSSANLSDANLSDALLNGANLNDADLWHADLRNADLIDADLINADLSEADLKAANLSYANLRNANLIYADLRGADRSYANLKGANLRYAEGVTR